MRDLESGWACRIFRSLCIACTAAAAGKAARSDRTACHRAGTTGIQPSSATYLLNPSGDLQSTQAEFEATFVAQATWQVHFEAASCQLQQGIFCSPRLTNPCGHIDQSWTLFLT